MKTLHTILIVVIISLLYVQKTFCQDFHRLSEGKIKQVELINKSFLGGWERNYYGNEAPSRLDMIWKFYLGKGKTVISKKIGEKEWAGSGWTGQPLMVKENDKLFLIQGAFDHHLRKIDAAAGKQVWKYKFDDVIKGTGTLWLNENAATLDESLLILQGSRRGFEKDLYSRFVPSFRAVSYFSGNELWRLDVSRTDSYSRDVDGSALTLGGRGYIGLENALFTVFNPDPRAAQEKNGMRQPAVLQQIPLYTQKDRLKHGGNLVVESSPALLNGHIYITAGAGHVYGYNLKDKQIDWDFYIGSDMDGSPVVTADSCLLVSVEKQYIAGKGGVFKLDPSRSPARSVIWYFAVENDSVESWQGGVIGSVGINDNTRLSGHPYLCTFIGIDGYLYVVNHRETDDAGGLIPGPDNKTLYPQPRLIFKKKIGPSISTPILVKDKLIAGCYRGLYLFAFDENLNFKLLDSDGRCSIESTPFVFDGKIYIGGRDGYLYCMGEKK